jgi:hypothetical protein
MHGAEAAKVNGPGYPQLFGHGLENSSRLSVHRIDICDRQVLVVLEV